jgi:hypothetical protein
MLSPAINTPCTLKRMSWVTRGCLPSPPKGNCGACCCCYYLPRISPRGVGTSSWLQQRLRFSGRVGWGRRRRPGRRTRPHDGSPRAPSLRWAWRDISNSSIILRVVLERAPTRLPKRVGRAKQGPHNRSIMINPRSSCW